MDAAFCLPSDPWYLGLQQTLTHHATAPSDLSVESKVLLYSRRLSEVVFSHDRRSDASLGALPAMLLSPWPFGVRSGGCPKRLCCSQPSTLQGLSHKRRNGSHGCAKQPAQESSRY